MIVLRIDVLAVRSSYESIRLQQLPELVRRHVDCAQNAGKRSSSNRAVLRHRDLNVSAPHNDVRTSLAGAFEPGALQSAYQLSPGNDREMLAQLAFSTLRRGEVDVDHKDRRVFSIGRWNFSAGRLQMFEHQFDDLACIGSRFLAGVAAGVGVGEGRDEDVEAAFRLGFQDHTVAQRELGHDGVLYADLLRTTCRRAFVK